MSQIVLNRKNNTGCLLKGLKQPTVQYVYLETVYNRQSSPSLNQVVLVTYK